MTRPMQQARPSTGSAEPVDGQPALPGSTSGTGTPHRGGARGSDDGAAGRSGRRPRVMTGRRLLGGAVLAVTAAALLTVALLAALRPHSAPPAAAPAAGPTTGPTDPLSREIQGLQQQLRAQPDDYVGWGTLGIDYVQRAKDTVDPAYYPKAEGVLQRSLRLNTADNFVAMAGMADLRAAQHDFPEALAWAQRANRINPYNSTIYGALADAYTQLGRYDDAAHAVQRMLDLKPGTPSLTRAEYVFELRGQVDQARAVLQRALADATTPAEQAFTHYYLGELALASGDARQALAEQNLGLSVDPGYPDLLEGRAKAEAALGQQQAALRDFAAVVARVPQPQYVVEAGEYLESLAMREQAQQDYDLFATEMKLFTSNGVQLDVEPTLFYADHGSPALALRYGAAGIRARPFLEMDDAYAWALHVNHRDAEALTWADKAMATGMRNALFAYHRGMIEKALGQRTAARHDLSQALALNPAFNPLQAPVARRALAELGGPE
jgi:tetratricopeptide (TPR) repeat protein